MVAMSRSFEVVTETPASVEQIHAAYCQEGYWQARIAAELRHHHRLCVRQLAVGVVIQFDLKTIMLHIYFSLCLAQQTQSDNDDREDNFFHAGTN